MSPRNAANGLARLLLASVEKFMLRLRSAAFISTDAMLMASACAAAYCVPVAVVCLSH